MPDLPFRVLALDGGGIKGAFTAAVLAAWESETNLRVVDHFDLICGASTGGILAIALGLGIPAATLLQFYVERGPVIFPVTGLGRRLGLALRNLVEPKFSSAVLQRELSAVLGDRRLGESSVRLAIPAYDTLRGRIYVFKTAHTDRFKYDIEARAADIALATSAAPTYFGAATVPQHAGQGYVDGGVWANSPALVGVVEAMSFLGRGREELDVLSVGTTYSADSVRSLAGAGLVGWAPRIVDLLMNAQAEAANAQARLLVGEGRFFRVDCATRPGDYALDSSGEVKALVGLGRGRAVERAVVDVVRARFLNGTHAPRFVPAVPIAPVSRQGAHPGR